MKSTIFSKPLEYSLVADGEKWRQGDRIKGSLKIKNHGSETIDLAQAKMSLAVGNFKKIKSKDSKAFDLIVEKKLSERFSLTALEEKSFDWDFLLPEDCQITEKDKSLYLTFKTNSEDWPTGQLELVIEPKLVMMQFLEIFGNF